ncbi:hypothetical protein GCM10009677_25630 [Sphaerisporangium rubeum]|uniref:Uncharacterized protein n=1 Tax=Sphaerisporangium rubeum TaxID=321317 RepID=A0A7X0M4H8_9ACTN|nr:hypothetical protein [Sphaerisporangium rubeum]MBB6471275.1 hypothetical protein [Sphaerisporangium rubeum]
MHVQAISLRVAAASDVYASTATPWRLSMSVGVRHPVSTGPGDGTVTSGSTVLQEENTLPPG